MSEGEGEGECTMMITFPAGVMEYYINTEALGRRLDVGCGGGGENGSGSYIVVPDPGQK